MFPLIFLPALVALLLIASARAETNVTVDDTDPRIVYRPNWSFQADTDATQDRFNKTTHFTSKQGATASLTFSGALHVYYVGYGIRDLVSPIIPVTLQPQRGGLITVQTDAYRPSETRAQAVLYSSDRLDITETYTITVYKTNDTLSNSINVDAFILTQPNETNVKILAPTFGGVTLTSTAPRESGTTNTVADPSAQTSSIANADSSNTSPNTAAIAGGVLGGITFGILVAFFALRWCTKREREKRALGLPQYTDDYLRSVDPSEAPSYRKGSGGQPQSRPPAVTDRRRHRHQRRHSVPSTFYGGPPLLTPVSTSPVRAQRFAYIPPMQGKARYDASMASTSTPPSHIFSQDTEYEGATLPAYSR